MVRNVNNIPEIGSRYGGGYFDSLLPRMRSLMEVVDPSMPPMLASRISIEIEIVVTAIIDL